MADLKYTERTISIYNKTGKCEFTGTCQVGESRLLGFIGECFS